MTFIWSQTKHVWMTFIRCKPNTHHSCSQAAAPSSNLEWKMWHRSGMIDLILGFFKLSERVVGYGCPKIRTNGDFFLVIELVRQWGHCKLQNLLEILIQVKSHPSHEYFTSPKQYWVCIEECSPTSRLHTFYHFSSWGPPECIPIRGYTGDENVRNSFWSQWFLGASGLWFHSSGGIQGMKIQRVMVPLFRWLKCNHWLQPCKKLIKKNKKKNSWTFYVPIKTNTYMHIMM